MAATGVSTWGASFCTFCSMNFAKSFANSPRFGATLFELMRRIGTRVINRRARRAADDDDTGAARHVLSNFWLAILLLLFITRVFAYTHTPSCVYAREIN